MFRRFKEKNKNMLRLKLKSALKIEQISVVLKMRFILNRKFEFINIYLTVKFTNKIHPPPVFPFFLFKSMINNIPDSNK
jgi:hypothetical protein